ncbi:MAG: type II toxin-antitoxin system RelE/ParE family toxin [Alphaproteobacteria bacterium]|nr:type II toxin-antitoxin system RelE/ParE family toxin [Alphaproteobacteria bacterium]
MITFRSKALRLLWERNDPSGVNPNALPRVRRILAILEAAENLRDLDVPGFRFHALKGFLPRRYSMRVTGNWRVTFYLRGGNRRTCGTGGLSWLLSARCRRSIRGKSCGKMCCPRCI